MRHAHSLKVGPVGFRIGSDRAEPPAQLRALYAGYPAADVPDFTVRLAAPRPWRRWLRPQVAIGGDLTLPGAVPLPLAQGLLAAEMAMNLQVALGWRRHLLLHASVVERDGRAVVMTGESGAGKSTLAALLMGQGWRLLGDEFAMLAPDTGLLHPHPRLVSLKNESVAAVAAAIPDATWGPWLRATPKGDIRHLVPDARSRVLADVPARPALLLFPRFGAAFATRRMLPSEAFVRLTQASTNYVNLAELGFLALTSFVRQVPAIAVDYPDGVTGVRAVEDLCAAL
ncbi:HprK-related kinase A [Sphingomonas sp.]|jgi:HprK-related kinase A|uniref:HprK-related kinase A n=1 Tax=Sphingomonas sp. TaxID=28214 RepID=UPI002D80F7F2|nr:HprK-related kinase A [Sphingomonas sp.]HEU0044458.1 HprK-related kinase A [Sphingomonas sp.]